MLFKIALNYPASSCLLIIIIIYRNNKLTIPSVGSRNLLQHMVKNKPPEGKFYSIVKKNIQHLGFIRL